VVWFRAVIEPTSIAGRQLLCVATTHIPWVAVVIFAPAVCIARRMEIRVVAVRLWEAARCIGCRPIANSTCGQGWRWLWAVTGEFSVCRLGTVVIPSTVARRQSLCVTAHYIPRVSVVISAAIGRAADWLVVRIVAVGLLSTSRGTTLNPRTT